MNYQAYEPSPELSNWVKCYWTLESPAESEPEIQTIVPDGCMEMIFHFGDLYRQYTNGEESIIQPRCFVFGQLTQPLRIQPTGATGIFAIRFSPQGFSPFSSQPFAQYYDKAVPLKTIFGNEGNELGNKIINADTTEKRIEIIEVFLQNKLLSTSNIDRLVKDAVETILSANGQVSIEEVCQELGINRRQLERKFSATIGLSPKQLSKTIRLQTTLQLLLTKQFSSFTELAYEGEYYDQSHFIRDFKELTGFTPKEFYGEKLKMSALFYGTE